MSTSGEQLPTIIAEQKNNPAPFPAGVKYGGFWVRFIAFLIDALVLKVILGIIAFVFFGGEIAQDVAYYTANGFRPDHMQIQQMITLGMPLGLITIAIWWLYYTLMESSKWQATLGKLVFDLKVVDYEGRRISWGRANARYWSKILSTMILYIGFFMIGWTKRKQGLHDKIAETLVVRR